MKEFAPLLCLLPVVLVFVWLLWYTRCSHDWQLVDKSEFPPPIIIYKESGGERLCSGYLDDEQIERMCQKTIMLVVRCSKCGYAKFHKESA
jgi:hypothetical protein